MLIFTHLKDVARADFDPEILQFRQSGSLAVLTCRQHDGGSAEQIFPRIFQTLLLRTGHGMGADETAFVTYQELSDGLVNHPLHRTDIGHNCRGVKRRQKLFCQRQEGAHRSGEQDERGTAHDRADICARHGSNAQFSRLSEGFFSACPDAYFTVRQVFTHRKGDGAADESGTEDGDAVEGI